MKKGLILTIAGVVMLIIAGGILYFEGKTPAKAANSDTNKWSETWTISEYRNVEIAGPSINGSAKFSLGPSKWNIAGTLKNQAGAEIGSYNISYKSDQNQWNDSFTQGSSVYSYTFSLGNYTPNPYSGGAGGNPSSPLSYYFGPVGEYGFIGWYPGYSQGTSGSSQMAITGYSYPKAWTIAGCVETGCTP